MLCASHYNKDMRLIKRILQYAPVDIDELRRSRSPRCRAFGYCLFYNLHGNLGQLRIFGVSLWRRQFGPARRSQVAFYNLAGELLGLAVEAGEVDHVLLPAHPSWFRGACLLVAGGAVASRERLESLQGPLGFFKGLATRDWIV